MEYFLLDMFDYVCCERFSYIYHVYVITKFFFGISYNQPNVRAIMTSYVIKMLLYMDPI